MNVRIHGIVLAGGRSTRMGTDKALLPVNGRAMIRRICDTLESVCGEATVVAPFAEPNRYCGALRSSVRVVTDRYPGKGPLAGIHAGLSALPDQADYAFLTACDMPVFSIELYERMLSLIADFRADDESGGAYPEAVLCPGQPFHAFYRRSVGLKADQLLRLDERRLSVFTDRLRCVHIQPNGDGCFLNLNTPPNMRRLNKAAKQSANVLVTLLETLPHSKFCKNSCYGCDAE